MEITQRRARGRVLFFGGSTIVGESISGRICTILGGSSGNFAFSGWPILKPTRLRGISRFRGGKGEKGDHLPVDLMDTTFILNQHPPIEQLP